MKERLEGKRVDVDLREGWSHCSSHPETHPARGWGCGVCVCVCVGGGVTEVSLDNSPACRWLGDTKDLRPKPLSDSYHRAQLITHTHTHTHTQSRSFHIFLLAPT